MEVDYDIYSYLAKGLGNGFLQALIAVEKVKYRLVKLQYINIDKAEDDCVQFVFQLCDEKNKIILDNEGKEIIRHISEETVKNYFKKVSRNIYVKIQSEVIVVKVPETIKIPRSIFSNKNDIIKEGTWIDITKISDLKYYTEGQFKLHFKVQETDEKDLSIK